MHSVGKLRPSRGTHETPPDFSNLACRSRLLHEATGARTMSAYHKDNGEHLGSAPLPAVPYGNPMTYLHAGKQYIVVATGGGGGRAAPELIALALP